VFRNSRRMAVLAAAGAVAVVPMLSGCGAGSTPQSAMPTQLTEGVNVSVPQGSATPQVLIRNLFVLGPGPGASLAAGGAAPLYGTFINQVQERPDKLVGVSSPAFQQAAVAGGGLDLPAATDAGGRAVSLAGTPAQPPPVALRGLTGPLRGGEHIQLTLQFQNAGSIQLTVPVVPKQHEFATFATVPTDSPSPTGSPTGNTSTPTPGSPEPTPTPTVPSVSPS
jgi:copper(I)-binding protein